MSNSTRADLVALRTYARPKDLGGYETWNEIVTRVTLHQKWLWERAAGRHLNNEENAELRELRLLLAERKALVAGRTLWLGGTEKVKTQELSNFNCLYKTIRTIHDVVDGFHGLLHGSGLGFQPVPGILNGFMQPIKELEIVRSTRTTVDGRETNEESFDSNTGTWCLSIGDSGNSWAKSIGKLLAKKVPATKLVLDFAQIRPAGSRLRGFGWLCSGDEVIATEYPKIVALLNRKAGRLLDHIDILDLMNFLGVIQTGRRGAEIGLYRYGDFEWERFATAKRDFWTTGNSQRSQSNNSLMFDTRPGAVDIRRILDVMVESGGSEPGILNYSEMKRRAPYAVGCNPCGEVLLPDGGTCNLVTINLAAFPDDKSLHRAMYIMARANYRQCLVNLDDGLLQRCWQENNEFLRLCGTSLAGMVLREDLLNPFDLKVLKRWATTGAMSMASDLGMQHPKNITTGKPDGTVAKVMSTTEGIHRPLGKYIFNNITFSKHDEIVDKLKSAGYTVFDNPLQPDGVVVTFPVAWENVKFNAGIYNTESAVSQLERYRLLMENYIDHNQSITVSYGNDELEDMTKWLEKHWDSYVGVSFLPRTDPTKTAEDLGYPFLPQNVVTKENYDNYVKNLKPVAEAEIHGSDELLELDACESGVCPVR